MRGTATCLADRLPYRPLALLIRPAAAQLAPPASVQVVPDARRVQHPPGDEVHQVLDVGGARVETRRGRDHARARVVERDEVPEGLAVEGGLPYGHDQLAALLEGDARGPLQQVLGEAEGDSCDAGGRGGGDQHPPSPIRPPGRPPGPGPRRPVPPPRDVPPPGARPSLPPPR